MPRFYEVGSYQKGPDPSPCWYLQLIFENLTWELTVDFFLAAGGAEQASQGPVCPGEPDGPDGLASPGRPACTDYQL